MYVAGGVEALGEGSAPSTETVPVQRLLCPVQLDDGVLSHAAARCLDSFGYRSIAITENFAVVGAYIEKKVLKISQFILYNYLPVT